MVTTHYMDEAELCQRVGLMSQGRLVALGTPELLKQTRMRGQVLEINTAQPEQTLLALKNAQQAGTLPLDEVALYGAQVHAVVPNAENWKETIRTLLTDQAIQVHTIDWITPTLEDVFISSVHGN
jgi:ABC-2 type transport system ATP-binding protein